MLAIRSFGTLAGAAAGTAGGAELLAIGAVAFRATTCNVIVGVLAFSLEGALEQLYTATADSS